jgi:hypothetical protein
MVLLDSSGPDQFSLPNYPGVYDTYRRASALFPPLARLGLGRVTFGAGFAGLPPDARAQEQSFASRGRSPGPAGRVVAAACGLHAGPGLDRFRPEAARGHHRRPRTGPGRPAAQDKLAALSGNSAHRTVNGATHAALLHDQDLAANPGQAIRDVVQAVRTVAPLQP